MLSISGKEWRVRGEELPVFDDAFGVAQALWDVRKPAQCGLLQGDVFSDAPALLGRLSQALSDGELIGIFGDYDCDGITSTALWVRALRRRKLNPIVRLPHRINDGYGIQPKHIDEFAAQGVAVVLLTDTGITAHAAVLRAKALGIDVLIVDHHHLPAELPEALAIVHPERASKTIAPPSAATLGFALIDLWEGQGWVDRDIDLALATIGTIADVMPLVDTNRALVIEGLSALKRITQGPLHTLKTLSGIDENCTARDIAFGIAPRINAAGRMDDPMIGLRALLDGGSDLEQLCLLNGERQLQVEQHLSSLEETMDLNASAVHPFLFSVSPDFPPGIIGLLAGKLTEQTGKPSLIGSVRGDIVTASLRSPAVYPIAQALDRVSSLLLQYGGHAQAAGCSFSVSNIDALRRALIADVTVQLTADLLVPVSPYDLALRSVRGLDASVVRQLSRLEPFGTGNPEPRMVLHGATLQQQRLVGADGSHLQAKIDGIGAIGFRLGSYLEQTKKPIDVLCRFSLNTWNGKTSPQIIIDDLRQPVF